MQNISKDIYLIIISNNFENDLENLDFSISSVYNNLALMYYYLGERENSLKYYIKAINLNDNISLKNIKKDFFKIDYQLYLFLKNYCNSDISNDFITQFESDKINFSKLFNLKKIIFIN